MPERKNWVQIAVAAATLLVPVGRVASQPVQHRILPEFRADLTTGDVPSGHVGAGVHISTGTYVRLAVLAGAGRAWKDGSTVDSYRFEVQGRFHLDPFRDARFGVYGIGGVSASHDAFADWQSRLIVGGGIDLPAHGRAIFAIETALAGGFRVSIVTRRVPLGHR